MERTGVVSALPQIKAQVGRFAFGPRPGQRLVFEALAHCGNRLCIKLPTGYGKTYTALGCYSILRSCGVANRMLVVFPTEAQLEQFASATPSRLRGYGIDGPRGVCDVRFHGVNAIRKHQDNACQVFAITAQSLIGDRGMNNIQTMLQKGRWMIVIDEYHHYGVGKQWGNAVNALPFEFLLCMSATPYRPNDDSAFGAPAIDVTYRQAVEEDAVKELQGHAYHYKIDVVNADGELSSYTTEEIIELAGGDSEEKIEKLTRTMRFSPKYISPLITNPIDRMLRERIKTGHMLQAVVGCMSVSHAQLVCEQIATTFPHLDVEWVGTGTNGRPSDENARIIKAFAPDDGSDPSIDVLVHVGMAGEGLDTVNVSEVIHLNAAGVNNSNNQENGRAARYLPGVIGHINFDGCSGYAKEGYTGRAIMDAMDCMPPSVDEVEESQLDPQESPEWRDLPEEPEIRIHELECIKIDSGDETVQLAIEAAIKDDRFNFTAQDFEDPQGTATQCMIQVVRQMRKQEAEQLNEKSAIRQLRDRVDSGVAIIARNVMKMNKANGLRCDGAAAGEIQRKINAAKKRAFGAVDNNVELLRKHYSWLKALEAQIKSTGTLPPWLT